MASLSYSLIATPGSQRERHSGGLIRTIGIDTFLLQQQLHHPSIPFSVAHGSGIWPCTASWVSGPMQCNRHSSTCGHISRGESLVSKGKARIVHPPHREKLRMIQSIKCVLDSTRVIFHFFHSSLFSTIAILLSTICWIPIGCTDVSVLRNHQDFSR